MLFARYFLFWFCFELGVQAVGYLLVLHFIYIFVLNNSSWTYAIICWWCWIQAFNLACSLHFAILWTCSCSSWGALCSCLISIMVDFSFSNWAQAMAMSMATRDGKPQVKPSSRSDVRLCKNAETTIQMCLKIISLKCIHEKIGY